MGNLALGSFLVVRIQARFTSGSVLSLFNEPHKRQGNKNPGELGRVNQKEGSAFQFFAGGRKAPIPLSTLVIRGEFQRPRTYASRDQASIDMFAHLSVSRSRQPGTVVALRFRPIHSVSCANLAPSERNHSLTRRHTITEVPVSLMHLFRLMAEERGC
jgi:hypothetical protein